MAEDQFQEKTEDASPRKREKAREQGQVAKSIELNGALMLSLGCASILALAPFVGSQMNSMMIDLMSHAAEYASFTDGLQALATTQVMSFLIMVGPIMLVLLLIGTGASIMQVGFKITPEAMAPKLEKLNVLSGLKRLFSMRSGVTLVRDTIKLILIGIVAYAVIVNEVDQLILLPDSSIGQIVIHMTEVSLWVGIKIGAVMLVMGGLDYFYQRYELEKTLRMSKQELKEEYRDSEGSPKIKSRIRQIQRDRSRQRMMQAVPTADVVITNPTHLAIALKYDADSMNAPTVVAKGERLVALRIRELAMQSGVPVIEDKQLARALFKLCDIGQMVPQSLYRAVAELLAYVYRLKSEKGGRS